MNKLISTSIVPAFTLITGAVGLALRSWLMLSATDEKGLLVPSHPANALIFILTALVITVLFLCVRPLGALDRYQALFPRPILSGVGCMAGAVGMVCVSLRDRMQRSDGITALCLGLGILAAVCLVAVGICRFRQRRPGWYLHSVVTIYLMLHLVSQYRLWSSEPQLQVYFFPLLASVFLMLTAYYSAVLDARKSGRRWFVFCNQSALFCCCLSLWSDNRLFYASMVLWLSTGLCSLEQPQETP